MNKNNHIPKGRLVEYIDNRKPIYGFWDGEKAIFTDINNTIVRKAAWLRVLRNENKLFYLYVLLIYIPYSIIWRYLRRQWLIKTKKLIPCKD